MWSQQRVNETWAQANGVEGPEHSYGAGLALFDSSGPKSLPWRFLALREYDRLTSLGSHSGRCSTYYFLLPIPC
jgi:hypothetical protein